MSQADYSSILKKFLKKELRIYDGVDFVLQFFNSLYTISHIDNQDLAKKKLEDLEVAGEDAMPDVDSDNALQKAIVESTLLKSQYNKGMAAQKNISKLDSNIPVGLPLEFLRYFGRDLFSVRSGMKHMFMNGLRVINKSGLNETQKCLMKKMWHLAARREIIKRFFFEEMRRQIALRDKMLARLINHSASVEIMANQLKWTYLTAGAYAGLTNTIYELAKKNDCDDKKVGLLLAVFFLKEKSIDDNYKKMETVKIELLNAFFCEDYETFKNMFRAVVVRYPDAFNAMVYELLTITPNTTQEDVLEDKKRSRRAYRENEKQRKRDESKEARMAKWEKYFTTRIDKFFAKDEPSQELALLINKSGVDVGKFRNFLPIKVTLSDDVIIIKEHEKKIFTINRHRDNHYLSNSIGMVIVALHYRHWDWPSKTLSIEHEGEESEFRNFLRETINQGKIFHMANVLKEMTKTHSAFHDEIVECFNTRQTIF